MTASLRSTEAAVIGGGLIGLSIAYELARRGASVRVFDRAEPARGASWAGAGMLAPFTESIDDVEMLELMALSLQRYPEFTGAVSAESGVDPHLRLDGILDVADDEAQLEALCNRAKILSARGRTFDVLSARDTVALEPSLSNTVRGGLVVHGEGQVDNRLLGRALLTACKRRGVDIRTDCMVHAVQTDSRRILGLRTSAGFLAAGVVINATGAWSAQLAGVPPECIAPVFPVKGQMLCLEIPKGFMRHVTWANGVYFVPRVDGRLLVGATVEDAGFDARSNAQGVAQLLNAALRAAPALRNFTIGEMWAGLRPGSPDGRPFIGQTPLEGYFLATGHYRNGILLAPSTAVLLGDLIERKPNAQAPAFSPMRVMPEHASF